MSILIALFGSVFLSGDAPVVFKPDCNEASVLNDGVESFDLDSGKADLGDYTIIAVSRFFLGDL